MAKKTDTAKYTEGNGDIKVLATIELSSDETLVVRALKDKQGNPRTDVRVHVENDNFTGWTKKGLRLSDKQKAALVKALNKK